MTAIAPRQTTQVGRPARAGQAKREILPLGYKIALLLWVVLLLEPQWYIFRITRAFVVTKLLLVCFGLLAAVTLTRFPKKLELPAMFSLAAFTLLTVPLAYAPIYAKLEAQLFGLYYVMVVGFIAFIRTPRSAIAFIGLLMGWQFTYWAAWGAKDGLVSWHTAYGNYDAFGPLMVFGAAGSFHLGLATKERRWKLLALGTAMVCVGGVVSAFARGSFISLCAVMAYVWWRSPRKGMMTLSLAGAGLVVVLVATVFMAGVNRGNDTKASFFAEMMTITEKGATHSDREILWGAAFRIWKTQPLIGVGGRGFGVAAANTFQPGELPDVYANPGTLYNRSLHNIWVQIFTEYGLIGSGLFLWMLWDFWKRNRALQKPEASAFWLQHGGTLDLRMVAMGLEAMMVAYVVAGMFYAILNVNWLFTVVAMNAVLHRIASAPTPAATRMRGHAAMPRQRLLRGRA